MNIMMLRAVIVSKIKLTLAHNSFLPCYCGVDRVLTLTLMVLDWSCLFLDLSVVMIIFLICLGKGNLGTNTESWRSERGKLTVSASPVKLLINTVFQSWISGILFFFFFPLFFRVPVVIWEVKGSGAGSNDPHWREHHLPPGTMQQSEEK